VDGEGSGNVPAQVSTESRADAEKSVHVMRQLVGCMYITMCQDANPRLEKCVNNFDTMGGCARDQPNKTRAATFRIDLIQNGFTKRFPVVTLQQFFTVATLWNGYRLSTVHLVALHLKCLAHIVAARCQRALYATPPL
jgi:hypothetical protein